MGRRAVCYLTQTTQYAVDAQREISTKWGAEGAASSRESLRPNTAAHRQLWRKTSGPQGSTLTEGERRAPRRRRQISQASG